MTVEGQADFFLFFITHAKQPAAEYLRRISKVALQMLKGLTHPRMQPPKVGVAPLESQVAVKQKMDYRTPNTLSRWC